MIDEDDLYESVSNVVFDTTWSLIENKTFNAIRRSMNEKTRLEMSTVLNTALKFQIRDDPRVSTLNGLRSVFNETY